MKRNLNMVELRAFPAVSSSSLSLGTVNENYLGEFCFAQTSSGIVCTAPMNDPCSVGIHWNEWLLHVDLNGKVADRWCDWPNHHFSFHRCSPASLFDYFFSLSLFCSPKKGLCVIEMEVKKLSQGCDSVRWGRDADKHMTQHVGDTSVTLSDSHTSTGFICPMMGGCSPL